MSEHPLVVPPAAVGVLGGGQLGRYAVMAARSMGYRTVVLEPDTNAPAGSTYTYRLSEQFVPGPTVPRASVAIVPRA